MSNSAIITTPVAYEDSAKPGHDGVANSVHMDGVTNSAHNNSIGNSAHNNSVADLAQDNDVANLAPDNDATNPAHDDHVATSARNNEIASMAVDGVIGSFHEDMTDSAHASIDTHQLKLLNSSDDTAAATPVLDPSKIPHLPGEVLLKIFESAVVAPAVNLRTSCNPPVLAGNVPSKEITMSVLRVSRDVHIAAHKSFLQNNVFDLASPGIACKITASDPSVCSCLGCKEGFAQFFNNAVFTLSDSDSVFAAHSIEQLSSILDHLQAPIKINSLAIKIEHTYHQTVDAIDTFLESLAPLIVQGRLVLYGLDTHLSIGIRRVASELGMKVQPTHFEIQPRSLDSDVGEWYAKYEPAVNELETITDFNEINDVHDPLSVFAQWQEAAEASLQNNP